MGSGFDAGLAVTGVGSIVSGILGAQAAQRAANARARVATVRGIQSFVLADEVRFEGRTAATLAGERGRITRGAQRAALAANGVEVDEGTAATIQSQTAALTALDAAAIRTNAMREASALERQGAEFFRQADEERQGGSARATGSLLDGVAGAIGPFARLANRNSDLFRSRRSLTSGGSYGLGITNPNYEALV